MKNDTQLKRYKLLLAFIDQKFKEDIHIPEIEQVCHYSYRNINRIFEALHHETIGKYIKRIRLERAAQYLKYSQESISEIAYNVGFGEVAAFSKAFKKKFNCSPSTFRTSEILIQDITTSITDDKKDIEQYTLAFEIEQLPDFQILGLEYRGTYQDINAIHMTWKQLANYATKQNLLNKDTIYLGEILDDDIITEDINCRYTAAIIIEDATECLAGGFFTKKVITSKKYAKFIHKGSHESCSDTYKIIYSHWLTEIKLEMADAPILEFYLNDETDTPTEDLLTEIYIPIH